jgi:hypothetical protein
MSAAAAAPAPASSPQGSSSFCASICTFVPVKQVK